MLPNEQPASDEGKPSRKRINWDLYYYERRGERLFFRITPFAIILMLFAALAGITIIIIDLRKNPPQETNINVTVPPATSDSPNGTIVRPGTLSSPAKDGKRSVTNSPSPPASNANISNRAVPQATPVSESPPGK